VELDRVAPKADVIRRIGFVSESEVKAKSLGIELDRAFDVACAYNRVRLFEHGKISTGERMRVRPPHDQSLTTRPTGGVLRRRTWRNTLRHLRRAVYSRPVETKKRFRMTKGRIACAVVLLPVLYVLNYGPLAYCSAHLGLPVRIVEVMYMPLVVATRGTALWPPCEAYINWWEALP
jgi:hypothetical protein